jgi:hypothetical protein
MVLSSLRVKLVGRNVLRLSQGEVVKDELIMKLVFGLE